MLMEKALQYAQDVVSGKEITTKYVKIQCQWFLRDLERQSDDDFAYYYDEKELKKIEGILSLLNYATGIDVVGLRIIDKLAPFQAFFLCNIFGWRFKSEPTRFKHREGVLFIPRKNGKTWLVAIVMIILLLTSEKYSELYSVCIDRELAAETKKAISQIIEASPKIAKYFKVPVTISGKVVCTITKSFFQARTSNASSNNAIRPSCFCADELGAYTDYSNVNSMKSGQLSVKNPLRLKMTTAYPEDRSIMLDELDYLKKVFDEMIPDDRVFALLYYAEESELWTEKGLLQANPLRIPENLEEIRNNRETAINKVAERVEYLCKHVNHFMPTNSGEEYINIDDLRKCKIPEFSWENRKVWVGIDMAMSNDNCSYSMVTCDEKLNIYADSFAFIPTDRIEEKNRMEKLDYNTFIKDGKCFACGDVTIDYNYIETMLQQIEEKHGVTVMGFSYDRYNCLSTAQKLELLGYRTVEAKQSASVLHPSTKLLREKILSKEFFYTENKLLEINFVNARCMEDANLNMYVNKKRSTGKVDMVVSMINAIFLMMEDVIFNPEQDWGIQVI